MARTSDQIWKVLSSDTPVTPLQKRDGIRTYKPDWSRRSTDVILPALGKAHQLVADRSTALSLEKVPLAPEEEAFAPWTSGSAHLNPAISFSPQVISDYSLSCCSLCVE